MGRYFYHATWRWILIPSLEKRQLARRARSFPKKTCLLGRGPTNARSVEGSGWGAGHLSAPSHGVGLAAVGNRHSGLFEAAAAAQEA